MFLPPKSWIQNPLSASLEHVAKSSKNPCHPELKRESPDRHWAQVLMIMLRFVANAS